jgi:hypothetical protein
MLVERVRRPRLPLLAGALLAPAAASAGSLELVSTTAGGGPADGTSFVPVASENGRYVAFASRATNLVTGDANGAVIDAFVRDRQTGVTERVSVSSDGVQGNGTMGIS